MMTDPAAVSAHRSRAPGNLSRVRVAQTILVRRRQLRKVDADCRTAAIGCVDCKKLMAENLVTWIEPVQARRNEFEAQSAAVWDILDAGGKKAHERPRAER